MYHVIYLHEIYFKNINFRRLEGKMSLLLYDEHLMIDNL